MREAVCIEEMSYQCFIKVIFQVKLSNHDSHLLVHLFGTLYRDSFAICQLYIKIYTGIVLHGWGKLKAFLNNLQGIPVFKLFQGIFEPAFTDITKRAHHVRPYFNLQFLLLHLKCFYCFLQKKLQINLKSPWCKY